MKLQAAQSAATIGGYSAPMAYSSQGLLHWQRFPLTLVVATLPTILHDVLTLAEAIEALRRWECYSSGSLLTVLANNNADAQVLVRWDGKPMPSHPYEAGHCRRYVTSGGVIEKAVITIVPTALIDGRLSPAQRKDRVLNTLAHEMGHALGLEHHVDPKALMHPQGWRNTHPNNSDRQQWMRLQRKV